MKHSSFSGIYESHSHIHFKINFKMKNGCTFNCIIPGGQNQKLKFELNELKTEVEQCNERYKSECSKVKDLKRAMSDVNRLNQSLISKRLKSELPGKENFPPSANIRSDSKFDLNSISEKNKQLSASLKKNETQLIAMQTENDRLTNLLKEGAPQAQIVSLQQYNAQLTKKIQDLTSILEIKESRLMELEKKNEQLNSDLVDKNVLCDDQHNGSTENKRIKLLLESNIETISQLKTQLYRSYQIRNGLLHTVMDLKGNYRVFVRLRPIQNHESSSKTFQWNCSNESVLHLGNDYSTSEV